MQNTHLKAISLGIMLLVASWAIKQLFVSMALFSAGGAMDEPVLYESLKAEWHQETREQRLEIALERTRKEPNSKEIGELEEEIQDVREDIFEDDEVIEDLVDADIAAVAGGASALNWAQWFLRLKMLLDLLKIAAVFFMIKGALGLMEDESADSTTRWFGIGTTVVVLFTVLVTGFFSWFA